MFDYRKARTSQKVYKYEEVKSNIPTTLESFDDFADVTDQLVKSLQRFKIDVFKECVECTGQDCGVTKTPVEMHNYVKGEADTEEYTGKTILESIQENYSKFVNFGGCCGGGAWLDAINQMAAWYQANVHTYQAGIDNHHATGHRQAYPCDLLGGSTVYDDCSGFTSACLQLAGIFSKGTAPTSGGFANNQTLLSAGFTLQSYGGVSASQPGDILIMPGHVEISAGGGNSWGWGNCNDNINGHYGILHPEGFIKGYNQILRPSGALLEGTAGGDPSLTFGGGSLKVTGDTKHLELLVKRGAIKDYGGRKGCFGQLYINGSYFCDCAERATNTTGKLHPTGKKFKVVTKPSQGNSHTGRDDWMAKGRAGNPLYAFAKISNGYVPQIMGTGGSGIRIHEGQGPGWSEGCLIVGTNKGGSFSTDSTLDAWKSIYSALIAADDANITYS